MASGQVVRRLVLAQKIVGSNPTSPAIQKAPTNADAFCMSITKRWMSVTDSTLLLTNTEPALAVQGIN